MRREEVAVLSKGLSPSLSCITFFAMLRACTVHEDTVSLTGPGQSAAVIHLHGATIISWLDFSGAERLYLSPTAVLDGTAPIRGGIPICWPQFGPGPLWPQQHGFARRLRWAVDEDGMEAGVPRVVLRLGQSEESGSWKFGLQLTVSLGMHGELNVEMDIKNCGEKMMTFSTALHAYFLVRNIEEVAVRGLKGLAYRDSVNEGSVVVEEGNDVKVEGEVDRIYTASPDKVELVLSGESTVVVEKYGLPELVVWNPAAEKAAALKDMPDEDWKKFVCLEPAAVFPLVEIEGGRNYVVRVALSIREN